MPTQKTDGNCYICGCTLGKTAMKNHIIKEHATDGDEECLLLKIEGAYSKEYWLYADVAKTKGLSTLDTFLRKIWLECCGHLSKFSTSKSRKIGTLDIGEQLLHEYDYGSTTECIITVIAESRRPKQSQAVRLLARNTQPAFKCTTCDQPATIICHECFWDDDDELYCKDCYEQHEHEDVSVLITNSPRCGECGYDGELDTFTFDPSKF